MVQEVPWRLDRKAVLIHAPDLNKAWTQRRDWTIFDQPFLLLTYNQIILPVAILGKRPRETTAPDLMLHPPCFLPPP